MSVSTIKIETDLVTLLQVLDKTGNPTVAIQILNGTYQIPEMCMADRASHPSKDGTREQFIFESYDIWTDMVNYRISGYHNSRNTSREIWAKFDLWADYERRSMAEAILDEMDDVADTEQGF